MEQRKNLTRDQLVTVGDLADIKEQLLQEIKSILKGHGLQQTKKWLKSMEVRKMLNISAGKLQYLRDRGEIPFTKLGGITYYDVDKITHMMDHE
ncbi:MAG: helix-turn-helix domain-containing protein [Mucilaginibacter sp.]